jgi:hypothetical protein
MDHKLAKSMNMWKENRNTTAYYYFLRKDLKFYIKKEEDK